jgi:hypothetical protein
MSKLQNSGFFSKQADVPVIAFNLETNEIVGEFKSVSKAARALFIKSTGTIFNNLYRSSNKNTPKGVKSKKTGNKYYFKLA